MLKYDELRPFSLVIHITKGDRKGEILDRMRSGTQVGYKTAEEAEKACEGFRWMADGIPGEFKSYGTIVIVNEATDLPFAVATHVLGGGPQQH